MIANIRRRPSTSCYFFMHGSFLWQRFVIPHKTIEKASHFLSRHSTFLMTSTKEAKNSPSSSPQKCLKGNQISSRQKVVIPIGRVGLSTSGGMFLETPSRGPPVIILGNMGLLSASIKLENTCTL